MRQSNPHGRTQRERGWPPRGETNAVTRGAAPFQSPPPTLRLLSLRLPSLRLPSCSRWQLSDSKGGLVRCGAWKPLGPTDLSCADLGSADRQRLTAGARTPGARSPAATFRAHGGAARWRDRMMNGTSVRPPHLPRRPHYEASQPLSHCYCLGCCSGAASRWAGGAGGVGAGSD